MTILHALVDHLGVGAVAVTDHGRACYCNDRAELILGRRPDTLDELLELLGRNPSEMTQSDGLGPVLEATAERGSLTTSRAGDGGPSASGEIELQAVALGEEGDVLLLVTSQRAEAIAIAQAERLERLAAVGQLSAGVTHEVNNVLTAILGWSQIALRAPDQVEKVESALGIIEESCRRAKSIIDDVMGFARPSSSYAEPVQLSDIADEVVRVLSFELHNAGVTMERSYRDVPLVVAHRRKLFQVFLNLVLNALQAMPEGGRLLVATSVSDDMVSIAFRDTGQGMDGETMAKVFEPQFTTKSPKPSGGGSGMGLTICRKLVTALGGAIGVESEVGAGSVFTVSVPSATSTEHAHLPGAVGTELPKGLKVLVVDDEPHIREMLREALEGSDAEVVIARSGFDAIDVSRRQRFDLAVVDFSMPGISGRALVERLKQPEPRLKVLVVTGRLDETDLNATGVDLVLRKPFDLAELQTILIQALGDGSRGPQDP